MKGGYMCWASVLRAAWPPARNAYPVRTLGLKSVWKSALEIHFTLYEVHLCGWAAEGPARGAELEGPVAALPSEV